MHGDTFWLVNVLQSSFVQLPRGFPSLCWLISRAGLARWAREGQRHEPSTAGPLRAPLILALPPTLTWVTLIAQCDLPAGVFTLEKAAQGVLAGNLASSPSRWV